MQNLDHDSITTYLSSRAGLLILVRWTSPSTFVPIGFAFPSTLIGTMSKSGEKAIFGAYGFFSPWWGKPDILVLTILGLAYFYREFGLIAVHGLRYADNDRTARLMAQVGFRDDGTIPRYMCDQRGKLVDAVVSTLEVEEFEPRALKLLEGIVGDGEGIKQQSQSADSKRDVSE
jgi:hypothetical protein